MKLKSWNWKEIGKVSLISTFVGYLFLVLTHSLGPVESLFTIYWTAIWAVFPLLTALILSKTLKNEKWTPLVGSSVTLFLFLLLEFVDDVFLSLGL